MKKAVILVGLTITVFIVSISLAYNSYNQSFYFKEYMDIKSITLPNIGNLSLYDYYNNLERPFTDDYSLYVLNPYDDEYLNNYFNDMTFDDTVSYCRKIPYKSEIGEYAKYPVETIIDNCGDCEDKSILCASILSLKGYNVSLVRFDSHMMILFNNTLIESTGTDNNRYSLENAINVYPVISHPIFVLNWSATIYSYKNEYYVSFNISVYNYGDVLGDTILQVFDNVTYYDFPVSIDAFSISLIDLNIEVLSKDIDSKLNVKGEMRYETKKRN